MKKTLRTERRWLCNLVAALTPAGLYILTVRELHRSFERALSVLVSLVVSRQRGLLGASQALFRGSARSPGALDVLWLSLWAGRWGWEAQPWTGVGRVRPRSRLPSGAGGAGGHRLGGTPPSRPGCDFLLEPTCAHFESDAEITAVSETQCCIILARIAQKRRHCGFEIHPAAGQTRSGAG